MDYVYGKHNEISSRGFVGHVPAETTFSCVFMYVVSNNENEPYCGIEWQKLREWLKD